MYQKERSFSKTDGRKFKGHRSQKKRGFHKPNQIRDVNITENNDSNESKKNPLVHSDERQRKKKRFFFTVECQLIYTKRRAKSENHNFATIIVITASGKNH